MLYKLFQKTQEEQNLSNSFYDASTILITKLDEDKKVKPWTNVL
jgi:hypothetical protein